MQVMLGVDEAGRGPLAGPVVIGVVALPEGFDVSREFPGVKDSKKLSEKKREQIFEMLRARVTRGDARYSVQFESNETIDNEGISTAVRKASTRGILDLAPSKEGVKVFLDGLLHAPEGYTQETIINGDALIPIISLASIVAKVSRDRLMIELAKKFPAYGFERHKGYGTSAHYTALRTHGLSVIHRRSFVHLDTLSAQR